MNGNFQTCQRLSIKLRSGLWLDHSNTFRFLVWNPSGLALLCLGSLSRCLLHTETGLLVGFPVPVLEQHSARYDATSTMLHCGYGFHRVIKQCGGSAKHRPKRPENLFPHDSPTCLLANSKWDFILAFFSNGFHLTSLGYGCPVNGFSHLGCVSVQFFQSYPWTLGCSSD